MTIYYVMKNNKVVLYDKSKKKLKSGLAMMPQYANLEIKSTELDIVNFQFVEPIKTLQAITPSRVAVAQTVNINNLPIDKPQPSENPLPTSFGGIKNNFSDELIANGYKDKVPEILGGGNLNYLLDSLGKTVHYSDTIANYITSIGVGKTPIVDNENKLNQTTIGLKVYNIDETFNNTDYVITYNSEVYKSKINNNKGNSLTDINSWERVNLINSDNKTILIKNNQLVADLQYDIIEEEVAIDIPNV